LEQPNVYVQNVDIKIHIRGYSIQSEVGPKVWNPYVRKVKKMKVAISSTGKDIESQISPIFGRCPYFAVVNIENNKIKSTEVIENPAINQRGGAGIVAAQIVGNTEAKAAISLAFGPRAFAALQQLEIEIYEGVGGTVKDNIEKFIRGELKKAQIRTAGFGFRRGFGRRGRWNE